MTKPKLHLDADASMISLTRALLERGHDVTRTPNNWMPLDATDEEQLLGATAQGRLIFTFSSRFYCFGENSSISQRNFVFLSETNVNPVACTGLSPIRNTS